MTTFRPPRVGDILHVQLGDGDTHSAQIDTVADDGRSITLSGPVGRHGLVVVIRRVDRFLQAAET